MKINNVNEKVYSDIINDPNALMNLIHHFKNEKGINNLGIEQIDNIIFFFKPVGRKDYNNIINNEKLNKFEKENCICELCTLYPEHFDFENCKAGIPSKLSNIILKNSFVDIDSKQKLLFIYRQEMYDLDNQITCTINEAFPQYDIEEIENWDNEKTAKYLSRAEWKLLHFRNAEFNKDIIEIYEEAKKEKENINSKENNDNKEINKINCNINKTENKNFEQLQKDKIETIEERQRRFSQYRKENFNLSEEEINKLKEKYPDMQWGEIVKNADEFSKERSKNMGTKIPAALRPIK